MTKNKAIEVVEYLEYTMNGDYRDQTVSEDIKELLEFLHKLDKEDFNDNLR